MIIPAAGLLNDCFFHSQASIHVSDYSRAPQNVLQRFWEMTVIIWSSLFSVCHMLRSLAHKSSSEKVTVGNVLSVCVEERGGLFCFARVHLFFLTKRLALWHPSCDHAVGGKGAWSVPPGAGRQGSCTLIASPRNCFVKIWVTSIPYSWKCSQPCFMKLSNKICCLLQLLILCKIYLIWANGHNKTHRVIFVG